MNNSNCNLEEAAFSGTDQEFIQEFEAKCFETQSYFLKNAKTQKPVARITKTLYVYSILPYFRNVLGIANENMTVKALIQKLTVIKNYYKNSTDDTVSDKHTVFKTVVCNLADNLSNQKSNKEIQTFLKNLNKIIENDSNLYANDKDFEEETYININKLFDDPNFPQNEEREQQWSKFIQECIDKILIKGKAAQFTLNFKNTLEFFARFNNPEDVQQKFEAICKSLALEKTGQNNNQYQAVLNDLNKNKEALFFLTQVDVDQELRALILTIYDENPGKIIALIAALRKNKINTLGTLIKYSLESKILDQFKTILYSQIYAQNIQDKILHYFSKTTTINLIQLAR